MYYCFGLEIGINVISEHNYIKCKYTVDWMDGQLEFTTKHAKRLLFWLTLRFTIESQVNLLGEKLPAQTFEKQCSCQLLDWLRSMGNQQKLHKPIKCTCNHHQAFWLAKTSGKPMKGNSTKFTVWWVIRGFNYIFKLTNKCTYFFLSFYSWFQNSFSHLANFC